jgi:hypothetical protein
MGFMTEVGILNDRWDEIRREPAKFVEEIYDASMGYDGHRYIIGQTTVPPSHHADDVKVYYSGQNSFFEAYPTRHMDERLLKYHLASLKYMTAYLKTATAETKRMLGKIEEKKV